MMTEPDTPAIDRVVDILKQARSLLFITGAGISADSGLPTYRGIGGLYNVNETDEGLPIEELLSGEMMATRPELTWKYLGQIEAAARGARFNRGHQVIAEMEAHFPRVWTLTQNVDGFHRQAGSRNLLEIHGDLHDLYCQSCDYRQTVEDYSGLAIPPRCPECQSMLRPDVVLFGEFLAEDRLAKLQEECAIGFDAVFTIGTTSVFPYISEPVRWASRCGWPTVEINPGVSHVSHLVDVRVEMRAAETLDRIWQRYQEELGVRMKDEG
jgi:NAD-dependent deacetylase